MNASADISTYRPGEQRVRQGLRAAKTAGVLSFLSGAYAAANPDVPYVSATLKIVCGTSAAIAFGSLAYAESGRKMMNSALNYSSTSYH